MDGMTIVLSSKEFGKLLEGLKPMDRFADEVDIKNGVDNQVLMLRSGTQIKFIYERLRDGR